VRFCSFRVSRFLGLVGLVGLAGLACAVLLVLPTGCGDDNSVVTTSGINDLVDQNQEFDLLPEQPVTLVSEEQVGDPWTDTQIVQDADGETEVTTTWIMNRERFSALTHPDEFVLYNVNASVLWPGNLIQGSSLAGGALNPIPITGSSRSPVTLFLSIVTGGGGDYSETVENPTGSAIFDAMNRIVGQHYGTLPGQASLDISRVYNMNHVMFKMNAGYSAVSSEVGGALGIDWNQERQRVMVKFAQQYYSMAYDIPQDAEAVFTDRVIAADLEPFTSGANPVCYVDSVTYGRVFYFVYESEDSQLDLESSLNIAFNGLGSSNVAAEAAYTDVVQRSTVKVFAMGGNIQDALTVATDFGALNTYLLDGAEFSADSPGVPISYTIRYLKNANLVRMNNTLEYEVDQAEPVGQPSSVTTSSTVNVYLHALEALAQDDGLMGGGSEGAIGVRVSRFESGVLLEQHDTGTVAVFEQGEFIQGAMRILDLNVPPFELEHRTGNKIVLEAYGWESDSDDNVFTLSKEYVYTFQPIGNTWILTPDHVNDVNQELHFRYDHNGDEFIEFKLGVSVSVDGSLLL
jgi:Thiol-activated cytolysin